MYRVQFEVAETTEQVFVGPDSIFIIINPIPYDFLQLEKNFSKTKYTVEYWGKICTDRSPSPSVALVAVPKLPG